MSRDVHWPVSRTAAERFRLRKVFSVIKRGATSWFTQQAIFIVTAYFAYFLVRGITEGGVSRATENAEWVVDLERTFGFFWEASWQATIEGSDFLVRAANSVYIYGHWPVIIVVAIWLALRHRSRYLLMRNAFLISGGIGLVFFAALPTAPPRLIGDLAIVDTVTLHSNAYRLLQPNALTNQYAAVPSLHLGWNMLMGMALVAWSPWLVARLIGFLLPIAMFFAVIVTGNHFIFDALAGIMVALIGFGVAVLISRRDSPRIEGVGAPAS